MINKFYEGVDMKLKRNQIAYIIVFIILTLLVLYLFIYKNNDISTLSKAQQITRNLDTPYGGFEITVPEILEYEIQEETNFPDMEIKPNMYMRFYFSKNTWFEVNIIIPGGEFRSSGTYVGIYPSPQGYQLEKFSYENDGRINLYRFLDMSGTKCEVSINATTKEYDKYEDYFKTMLDSIILK